MSQIPCPIVYFLLPFLHATYTSFVRLALILVLVEDQAGRKMSCRVSRISPTIYTPYVYDRAFGIRRLPPR